MDTLRRLEFEECKQCGTNFLGLDGTILFEAVKESITPGISKRQLWGQRVQTALRDG